MSEGGRSGDSSTSTVLGAVGRGVLVVGKILLPVLLLAAVAIGVLYVRLLNGPVSLSFLSAPIARSIAAELPGLNVEIEDSIVALRDNSFEFRLRNVRLSDANDAPIAIAPLAAVEVSRKAFLRGQISPSRIVLIEPRMLMFYRPDGGLSLTIAGAGRQNEPAERAAPERAAGTTGGAGEKALPGQIDLTRTIAQLAARARQRQDVTSYLDRMGLRNATVIVDHAGQRTALRVPAADFDLTHFDEHSVLAGKMSIASQRGAWSLALRAEESQRTQTVKLTAAVRDLLPETVAELLPGFTLLKSLQFPFSGQADLSLSSGGELLAGNFDVALGQGRLRLPWLAAGAPRLDAGRLRFRYRRGQDHLEVLPTTLRWAGSDITLAGRIAQRALGDAGVAWDFKLRSRNGRLATGKSGEFIKLEELVASGSMLPAKGIINLDGLQVRAGGGQVLLNGAFYAGQAPGLSVSGRFGPMLARNFLGIWPEFLATDVRNWAAKNVMAGQLRGGAIAMRYFPAVRVGAKSDYSMELDVDLADVRVVADVALPPLYALKAKVKFKDDQFDLVVQQSAFVVGGDRSLFIDDLHFVTRKIFDENIDGEAAFKVRGDVKEALEIGKGLGLISEKVLQEVKSRVSGRVDGRLQLQVPIVRGGGDLPKPTASGQIRILDGQAKDVWQRLDVKGSKVLIDVAPKGLSAKGQLLLAGIPVRMSWQRLFDIVDREQPPLRLSAKLDEADRKQLRLAVNHMVQGAVDVNLIVRPHPAGQAGHSSHVWVDLTGADISIESLAWRKAKGRRATLEFDIVPRAEGATMLDNIRLEGDSIAVRGHAQLDAKNRVRSFEIPEFTIDVVTRLQIKGDLGKGNVWRVSAQGSTFEGREFFRALFSAGRLKGRAAAKNQPGLDLNVRIGNVLGFWQTRLKDVRLDLSKRDGKIVALNAGGKLSGGGQLSAVVKRGQKRRRLVTTSNNAGETFKLVGFYPNARRGALRAVVDLDGRGPAERSGVLEVQDFSILGDPVVNEVLQSQGNQRAKRGRGDVERQVIQFDWMRFPFQVGRGQFLLDDAELRGPVLGVLLCGQADFHAQRLHVAGTYVPLQGLNAAVGVIPGIGQLLAGPKGEGVLGITFEVRGDMRRPEVLINPLSMVAPGIIREMFQVACPTSKVLRAGAGKSGAIGQPSVGSGWTSETLQGPSN